MSGIPNQESTANLAQESQTKTLEGLRSKDSEPKSPITKKLGIQSQLSKTRNASQGIPHQESEPNLQPESKGMESKARSPEPATQRQMAKARSPELKP